MLHHKPTDTRRTLFNVSHHLGGGKARSHPAGATNPVCPQRMISACGRIRRVLLQALDRKILFLTQDGQIDSVGAFPFPNDIIAFSRDIFCPQEPSTGDLAPCFLAIDH